MSEHSVTQLIEIARHCADNEKRDIALELLHYKAKKCVNCKNSEMHNNGGYDRYSYCNILTRPFPLDFSCNMWEAKDG